MELIITTFQARRILGVVKDLSIQDKIEQAPILAERQKIDLTRLELMRIMHSLIPSELDNDLAISIGQTIDRATSIACNDKVRIVGKRGQMPQNTVEVVKSIIEADIDHRNYLETV